MIEFDGTLTSHLPQHVRARGLELCDRARNDALDLIDSTARRWAPSGAWSDRVDAAVKRHRPARRHRMMPLLEGFAGLRPHAFFVQIGSNDGQQQDPLREVILRFEWAGIMVEPVPYVFERLRTNCGHLGRIALENVAVGPTDGTVPFYHLADTDDAGRPDLPSWFDALGSMKREVVLAHQRFIPDIEDRLLETTVPCLTFESLCRRHGVEAIDVLHTDTEGYDYEILQQVDLARLRPTLVIYESWHLDETDKAACATRLHTLGYDTVEYGLDTWCLDMSGLSSSERRVLLPIWQWIGDLDSWRRPLPATRAARAAARRLIGPTQNGDQLGTPFALSESEQRYLANGYDERTPLPPGAADVLSPDNPRLAEVRRAYEALDLPAAEHHMWTSARVSEHVDLRHFRGDNLYQWHYPEHPRAMALALFSYMRYIDSRGGQELLGRLWEDGAFGCWTAEIEGRGKVSRDLLDSVNEILFLERQLGVLDLEGLRVLDVGAGYGRLAYRMAAAHPSLADYCCVDAVPESTFLSAYYLEYRGCSPPARVVPLNQVTALEPGTFDLAVNIHSFSECTLVAIEWWAQQLARLEVPYLLVVPNQMDGIVSREVGGGYHDALPTLAAAGYRPVVLEPVIADRAVRDLVRIHDSFFLFARDDANGADGAHAIRGARRPTMAVRRRHVFCVGLPKCGTHSIAEMLSGSCRTAHEPESETLLPLLEPARSGKLAVGDMRSFFLARERRLELEVESSHLLGSFVPHLVDAFPNARFVLLVRDCRAWIDSMIDAQLNLRAWDGYPRWRVVFDQYLAGADKQFPPEERVLRDLDLYPISHYIRYWREEVESIISHVPVDRLLLLRTEELRTKVSQLADFVELPATAVDLDKSHSFQSAEKHRILDAIDPGYLDREIESGSRTATDLRCLSAAAKTVD